MLPVRQVGFLYDRWQLYRSPQFRHGTGGEGNILQHPALVVLAANTHKTFGPTNLTSTYFKKNLTWFEEGFPAQRDAWVVRKVFGIFLLAQFNVFVDAVDECGLLVKGLQEQDGDIADYGQDAHGKQKSG
ncbi:hypothetical protein TNCV_542011 [Trichonephila clavipes]|nr:hypothetical protein TNCV_542011 [Trichonephila clavipes]